VPPKTWTSSSKCNRRNAAALFRALAAFGAPLEGLQPEDFAEVGSFFRMGTPPVMVDILPSAAWISTRLGGDALWQQSMLRPD
jgi:hypothetical protein